MRQCMPEEYSNYIAWAKEADGDSVYPGAVAEGVQSGAVYTDGNAVLFHHFCGFAHIAGDPDSAFLAEIAARFFGETPPLGRFVLITARPEIRAFFAAQPGIAADERYYFRAESAPEIAVPAGFSASAVTPALLPRIHGRIIPSFSWASDAQFLRSGFGCCILDGETAAACAFSAAVTAQAADIGLETQEAYRRRGLAACAAAAVMREAVRRGKAPVWACSTANIASAKTAQKLGFRHTHTCTVLRRSGESLPRDRNAPHSTNAAQI